MAEKIDFGIPANLDQADSIFMLGSYATLTVDGDCPGINWYRPTNPPTTNIYAALYRYSDQALMGSVGPIAPGSLAAGYNDILFASTVPVVATEAYVPAILTDRYAFTSPGLWPYSSTHITAPATIPVTGNINGRLVGTSAGTPVFPANVHAGQANFFVGMLFNPASAVVSTRTTILLGGLTKRIRRAAHTLVFRAPLANASSQTQVKYRFGGLERKWRFTMLMERVNVTSLARVQTVVRADADGLPYDPRNASVEFAFLTTALANPAGGDWKTGSWDVTRIGEYVAQINVGPGGAATLTVGEYYVWIRLNDSVAGEIPVEPIAKLIVS